MTQLVKTEPAMPSLIKTEPDLTNVLPDESITSLIKTLMTLDPAVKSNLIHSILSTDSSTADDRCDAGAQSSTPQIPISMATTTPTKVVPAMRMPLSSSSPVLVSSSTHLIPSSADLLSSSHQALVSQMQNSPLVTVSAPGNQLPRSTPSLPSSLPSSLPQLVPVSSDFSSLVAAPVTTSIMNSGIPTSSFSSLPSSFSSSLPASLPSSFSSPLPTSLKSEISSVRIPVCTSQNTSVSDVLHSTSFISTNSTQNIQTAPMIDRSSTDSEELNMQQRKLADQLAAVRSRLLLSSFDAAGPNHQYLTQLVKLEQLIHVLQEAVAQRQVRAVQPSIILGGARCADEALRCAEEPRSNYAAFPSYDSVGVKRKTSPNAKAVQKSGKKIKHSGGSHGIQLWQFILELLGDSEHRPVLAWTGNGLEFRIINSVELARLWGIRKRNPIMNFDKLSRALRYYYEKNIIKHNPMHRLVYSFCNNPHDMVYNALLNRALATCPIDPELAKQQVGTSPYQWQDNLGKVPSSIKVTLQAVRNKMNGMVDEEKFPLSVNNS